MSLTGWANGVCVLFSFLYVYAACWLLLSAQGKDLIATDDWIPVQVSLGAGALIVVHLILHYR